MSLFFKSPLDIEILLDGKDTRKHVDVPAYPGSGTTTITSSSSGNGGSGSLTSSNTRRNFALPLYEDGESITGTVILRVREGKRVEHQGVKIAVIGSIDMVKSSGSSSTPVKATSASLNDSQKRQVDQFLCLSYDLCPAGEFQHSQSFSFAFRDLAKRYESYRGKNVDVSYYVKVTVMRRSTDISKVKRFWVYLYSDVTMPTNAVVNATRTGTRSVHQDSTVEGTGGNPSETDGGTETTDTERDDRNKGSSLAVTKPVKLDIGIENCLHIEFEYSKAQYSLKDVIVGRIYFLLTRLKIKHMELSLITRETSGLNSSKNAMVDSTAIRFEIMDGSPVKGETIPIRLFLGGYNLTPNMSCNYFNVKTYLSLVIIDEDGRRYFKQSEIVLYRTR